MPPEDYEIRYGSGNYEIRAYFITTTDQTQAIDLFAITNTSSSLILINVIDERGSPVADATVKAKRGFINRNNAYLVVEMEKTDQNGETGMYLEPYDAFYSFLIEDSSGTVIYTSSIPQKIYSTPLYFRATTLTDVLEDYMYYRDNITTTISYNNDTGIVSYTWNDASGNVQTGCLEIKKISIISEETFNETCADSSSGTININVSNIDTNYTYTAQGYVKYNPDFLTDIIQIWETKKWEDYGNLGLFISYIFIISMFFLGLPFNFSIATIYSIVSMIMLQIIGLSYFGWGLIITISLLGLIIAVKNKM
jgi:hypothetical protein